MKSVGKLVSSVVLVVLIIVLFAIAAFALFGEYAIKVGIETAGTKTLNVGLDIDDLDLSVLRGSINIEGLTVKNPPGYEYENLLELDKGFIAAKLGTLFSRTIEINNIYLDGISLVIEQKGLTNNLQDVLDSIPKTEKPVETERKKEAKTLHVKKLKIANTKVAVKLLPSPGKIDTVSLQLGTIEMDNLGSDDKLTVARLMSKIMLAIADAIAREGSGVLPDNIIDSMESAIDRLGDIGKITTEQGEKFLEAGKEKGQEILEEGKETGKDIVEGLKGILKKE